MLAASRASSSALPATAPSEERKPARGPLVASLTGVPLPRLRERRSSAALAP